MAKKSKENRYKPDPAPEKGVRSAENGNQVQRIFAFLALPALILFLSLGAILAHDLVTQSPLFLVKKILISGDQRVVKNEILKLAALEEPCNIFKVNLNIMEKQIASHPWIARASVRRSLFSTLIIRVDEETPLAIVNVENMARILINTQGRPFKEYDPETDQVESLPVISGVDLTLSNNVYRFEGKLFNSIMDFLKTSPLAGHPVINLDGDENTGIIINAQDIYNKNHPRPDGVVRIKLGFDRFREKLIKAKEISTYIGKNYPDKTISAMDLFDIEKVFIKIKDDDALHISMEKGV
ncbi:cell division protein FtsQ/DivIB [Desulfospira joergensenii]|uniref:cell division protein FtsQ/DivIB n=1 Tax=Desulfospira joergensenii TaxID=53329 RepID=UPI0003B4D2AF|nr:FtsQ-type POTRA domain-containing protein [Desulfospira joergensenii]